MELNFGVVPQTRQQQDLYAIAYYCASCHDNSKCNTCSTCAYNIDLMGYALTETKMIKARATIDFQKKSSLQQACARGDWFLCIGAIVVFLLLLFLTPVLMRADGRITIEEAIRRTHANLRDVNFDYQIDCIDYSVIFYEYYPGAKIIHCNNYKDFNHLLNKVGDRYVEPQALDGDPVKMWPKSFPGAVKDDKTRFWDMYASKKRW